MDTINEKTKKGSKVIKESQPERPPLAIENLPMHQSIENNEGAIFDVELEITLQIKRDNTGFF